MATWDTGAPNTSLLTTWLVKTFIPALEDELQFQKFTTKASIPGGMGNIARFNVFDSPAANVTALTEGSPTDNEIVTLSTTGTDATIAEYGEFIVVTRLMEFTQVKGAREELQRRLSYGAARSIDALVRDQADTTTSVFHATTDANGGSVAGPAVVAGGSAATLIGAARQLRDQSARGFAGVPGHPERHLSAIVSPEFELDMITEGEATNNRLVWQEAVKHVPGPAGQGKAVNGFMGSVYGTAVYRSQALTQATLTTTVDENFILAEGGLGAVSVIDADPQIFVNTPSAGDVGNPYRNRSTIAWHAYFATVLIDSNRVFKIYSDAS